MDLPIIARLPNGIIHLISGNTRLCVAKVIDFTPKVIMIDFPEKYFREYSLNSIKPRIYF